jgi:hypothetical protein
VDVVGLVDQPQRHQHAGVAAGDLAPRLGEALIPQVGRLVEGELEADRIERDDGGEQ